MRRTSNIPSRWRGTVALLVLLLFGASSHAQREIPVGSLDEIPAPGIQWDLLLAPGDGGFLATWSDRRSVPAGYASRIDSEGKVLDRLGIRLPVLPTDSSWDGQNYVVSDRTVAARVRPDGVVLDPTPRRVVPNGVHPLGFATNGPISISLYRVYDDGTWHVAPYDRNLEPLGPPIPLPLDDGPEWRHIPVGIASVPDGTFLVLVSSPWLVCPSGCPILGMQVDAAAAKVVRQFTIPAQPSVVGETAWQLAAGPDSFAIASFSWDARTIVSQVIGYDGSVLASNLLFTHPTGTYAAPPNIAAVSDDFLVSFSQWRQEGVTNRFARLDASGGWDGSFTIHGDDGRELAQAQLAWNGSATLVAFANRRPGEPDSNFEVGLMTPEGDLGDLRTLVHSLTPSSAVAIASNGAVDLVLFSSGSYGNGYQLRAAAVGPDGPRHAPGLPIATRQLGDVPASVAASPGGFTIVWLDGETIFSRRISLSGAWIDSAARAIVNGTCSLSNQALVPHGSGLALTWTTCPPSKVMLQRLDATGLPSGAASQFGASDGIIHGPVIVSGDGSRLVVWQYDPPSICTITCYYPPPGLRASLIADEGSPLGDTFELTPPGAGSYAPPAIIWTGTSYLVAWGLAQSVYALRIAGDGTFLDAFGGVPLTHAGEDPRPALGFDGARVRAFWSDSQDGVNEVVRVLPIDVSRPLAEQFGTETTTLSSGVYRGYSTPAVAVSTPGSNTLALLYSRVDTDPAYGGVSRVFTQRLLDSARVRPVRRSSRP